MDFRQLMDGVVRGGAIRGWSLALGLAATVLLARLLGPGAYGTYSLVLSILILVALPLSLGMPSLLLREIAASRSTGDWARLRGVSWFSGVLLIAATLLLLALFLLCRVLWSWPDTRGPVNPWIALSAVPLLAYASLQKATLNGLGYVTLSQVPEFVVRPLVFLCLLLAMALLGPLTSASALAALVVALLASVLCAHVLLDRRWPEQARGGDRQIEWSAWLGALPPLAFAMGSQVLNSQVDIVVLGLLASDSELGIYKVAATAAAQVTLVGTLVNQLLAPVIAGQYRRGAGLVQRSVIYRGVAVSGGAAVVVALLFAQFGEFLIELVFGSAYAGSLQPLLVLSLAGVVFGASAPASTYLTMTGRERVLAVSAAFALLANLGLNLLLVPRFGVMGAAIGTALATAMWRGALLAWVLFDVNARGKPGGVSAVGEA